MAALLDWASDDDHVLAPASRPKKPILWLGGTSPSVEAAIWRGDQLGSPVTRVSQAGAPGSGNARQGGPRAPSPSCCWASSGRRSKPYAEPAIGSELSPRVLGRFSPVVDVLIC